MGLLTTLPAGPCHLFMCCCYLFENEVRIKTAGYGFGDDSLGTWTEIEIVGLRICQPLRFDDLFLVKQQRINNSTGFCPRNDGTLDPLKRVYGKALDVRGTNALGWFLRFSPLPLLLRTSAPPLASPPSAPPSALSGCERGRLPCVPASSPSSSGTWLLGVLGRFCVTDC